MVVCSALAYFVPPLAGRRNLRSGRISVQDPTSSGGHSWGCTQPTHGHRLCGFATRGIWAAPGRLRFVGSYTLEETRSFSRKRAPSRGNALPLEETRSFSGKRAASRGNALLLEETSSFSRQRAAPWRRGQSRARRRKVGASSVARTLR